MKKEKNLRCCDNGDIDEIHTCVDTIECPSYVRGGEVINCKCGECF